MTTDVKLESGMEGIESDRLTPVLGLYIVYTLLAHATFPRMMRR
jgi:hypothetical protein